MREEHVRIDSEMQATQSSIRQLEFESADASEMIKRTEANLLAIPAKISALEGEENESKLKIIQIDQDLEREQKSLQLLLKKKRRLEMELESIAQRESLIQELAILTNEQRKSRELVARGLQSVNSIKQRADRVLKSIEIGSVSSGTNDEEDVDDLSLSNSEGSKNGDDLTRDDLSAFEAQLGLNLDQHLASELESKTSELEQISSEIQARILQHRTNVINQLRQVEEQLRTAEAATKELRHKKTRQEDEFAEKTRRLRQELEQKQRLQTDRDRLATELGQKQTNVDQKKSRLESLRSQATQTFVRINSIEDEIRQRDSATKQRREQIISKVEKWKSARWRLAEAEQQVLRISEELKEAQAIYLQRWSKMVAEQREGEKAHSIANRVIQSALDSTSEFDTVRLRIMKKLEERVNELTVKFLKSPNGAQMVESAVDIMLELELRSREQEESRSSEDK